MKIVSGSMLMAAVSVFAAMSAQAAPKEINLRVVTPFATGHILADTAGKFREELAKTAPHIKVEVKTGVLNEQSIDPAFQKCDAGERVGEVMLTGGQPLQDYAPRYFFFNGPYVIRDFAHLQKVWRGKIGQAMLRELEAQGNVVVFDPVYRGFRQFTAGKAINVPADFQQVKLRLPPTPDWIAVWQSLGVTPVQVPLPGIYEALGSGMAEASEGDLTQIKSLKLNEVQNHLILTNHLVGFGMTMANACFFKKELSHGDQAKVRAALGKAIVWGSHTSSEREAGVLADLQAGGMAIIKPNAAAIRAAAEPAINALFEKNWTVTTWKAVLAQ